jgi:CheY-like chemotaxis protein
MISPEPGDLPLLAAAQAGGEGTYASALPLPLAYADGRPSRVLIVEDSPAIAERLVQIVNRPGRVQLAACVATEADALEACNGNLFDLAIVDLQLAEGTGFPVVRRLRATRTGWPYVVVLTSHALPALEAAALGAGADLFLDKGRQFDRIERIVDALAATHG